LVNVLVGLTEINEMSMPSSLATTCVTFTEYFNELKMSFNSEFLKVFYFSIDALTTFNTTMRHCHRSAFVVDSYQHIVFERERFHRVNHRKQINSALFPSIV